VRPKIRVRSWWSGGYETDAGKDGLRQVLPGVYVAGNIKEALHKAGAKFGVNLGGGGATAVPPVQPWIPRANHLSAREQVEAARARAAAARERARSRVSGRRRASASEFKTMNAGVGVALLLFVAVVLAFGLMFTMVNKRGIVRIVSNYGDASEPSTRYASGDLTVGGSPEPALYRRDAAAGGFVKIGSPATAAPRVVINGVEPSRAGAAQGATATLGAGRSVLVISDLQPLPESVAATIGQLRASGFDLVGNYPGNPATGETLDEQLQLAAEAQMTRAMRDLDAPDLAREVSSWLADQHTVDALLWFGRGDEPGAARFHIFTPAFERGDDAIQQRDDTFRSIMSVVAPARK
jgi:hypothetical protein